MSVAKCLGVDDLDAPNMREVRAEWPRWRRMSSALPDLELADLPTWMKAAEPSKRDGVLTALRAIADDDPRAYVLLSWLLMPGAARVAGRIRRLADAIDAIVAGQLWIQICEHDPGDDSYVARKILDRVYRESMAELGVGEVARRRDQTWAGRCPSTPSTTSRPTTAGGSRPGVWRRSTICCRVRSTRVG